MGLYLIGIGGTGAKIIEAATHFCAAGLMPNDTLRTVFVDPDVSNGNLDRSTVTVRTYERCQGILFGDSPMFSTKVETPESGPWSPLGKQSNPTLGQLFEYNLLRTQDEAAAALFDVLYSKRERDTDLARGFRGHPSIGSSVLARSVKMESEEPWATLREQIGTEAGQKQPVRIFVAGSIFGGTGASGFPTIGRLLRRELEQIGSGNVGLGGMLMLPYFSFIPPKKVKENGELFASSDGFLVSSKAALNYYSQHAEETFDTIYLVGDRALSPVDTFSTGSSEQKNAPHFAELFAATAAMDFFRQPEVRKAGCSLVATRSNDRVSWGDIPHGDDVRSRLGTLARFAYAYLSVYYPALEGLKSGKSPYGTPWYVDHVLRRDVDIYEPEVWGGVEALREYSDLLLRWLKGLHGAPSSGGSRRVFLFDQEVVDTRPDVAEPRLSSFDDLVLDTTAATSTGTGAAKGLDDVWERMSSPRRKDPHASGIGHLAAELHRACEI